MNLFRYAPIFWQLFKTDMLIFRKTIIDKIINGLIWVSTVVVIFAYFMKPFGVSDSYGLFMAIGSVASCSGFGVFPQMVNFIADIEGDKQINYYITLPIPSWLFLIEQALVYSIDSLTLTTAALVTSKLVLWNRFDLTTINYVQLISGLIVINLFFGFFTVWIASFTKGMDNLDSTSMRIVYPLWFLGGFQFSWQTLYGISPTLAYINLLNPYLHSMEGLRAAAIGQDAYIPFWASMGMLIVLAIALGSWGILRLKKRLDFV